MRILMILLGVLGTFFAVAHGLMLAARLSAVGANIDSRTFGASVGSITLGVALALICFSRLRKRSPAS